MADLLKVTQEDLQNANQSENVEKDVYVLTCKEDKKTTGRIKFVPYFNADGTIGKSVHRIFDVSISSVDGNEKSYFTLTEDDNATHLIKFLFGIKKKLKNMGYETMQIKSKYYTIAEVYEDSNRPDLTNKIVVFRYNQTIKKDVIEASVKDISDLYGVKSRAMDILLKLVSKTIGKSVVNVPTYGSCSITDESYEITDENGNNFTELSEKARKAVEQSISDASEYLDKIKEHNSIKNINKSTLKEFKFILQTQYGITFNISDFFDSEDEEEVDATATPVAKPQQVKLEPVARAEKPEMPADDDDLFNDPKPSKPAKPAKSEPEVEAPANKYGGEVEDIF